MEIVKVESGVSSPDSRLEIFKGEKPPKEIVYSLNEFLDYAHPSARKHYEIIREPYDAGGLTGYKVYFILTTRSKEGHILKYEEVQILDPFNIEVTKGTVFDAMKMRYNQMVLEWTQKAKELGATAGRWA
jgi:hypothetical protein